MYGCTWPASGTSKSRFFCFKMGPGTGLVALGKLVFKPFFGITDKHGLRAARSAHARSVERVAPSYARNDARTALPARPAPPGPSDPTSDPRLADTLSPAPRARLPTPTWVWDNGARRDRPDAFFHRLQTPGEHPNRKSLDHRRPSTSYHHQPPRARCRARPQPEPLPHGANTLPAPGRTISKQRVPASARPSIPTTAHHSLSRALPPRLSSQQLPRAAPSDTPSAASPVCCDAMGLVETRGNTLRAQCQQ